MLVVCLRAFVHQPYGYRTIITHMRINHLNHCNLTTCGQMMSPSCRTRQYHLNKEKAQKGDVFYIPAGRVHALGPGILLAEIQQSSDTTYRIYDWDRVDDKGKSRELHLDLALEAIDFNIPDSYRTNYRKVLNQTASLVDSPHFTTQVLTFDKAIKKDYSELDSFVIYVCVEGDIRIECGSSVESIKKGEAILVPAIAEKVILSPSKESRILEVFIS